MGGSVGEQADTFLNATVGQALGNKNFSQIKSSAEDIQKHYGDQITNMIRNPMENMEDTVSDTAESAKNANPFSMGSYGNSMRQRRKSGFGRRQTFKGLTG
tara:strand:+ start:1580 stop:1882 length:303 start_codon:yes stop_codon:yes gene_type:complete